MGLLGDLPGLAASELVLLLFCGLSTLLPTRLFIHGEPDGGADSLHGARPWGSRVSLKAPVVVASQGRASGESGRELGHLSWSTGTLASAV